MKNQNLKSDLLDILTENLLTGNNSILKFIDFDESIETGINVQRIYKTKRKNGVRTLCVVIDLPSGISDANDLSLFFNKIRSSLTKKYAKFPFWKELGTFSIILCNNSDYEKLKNEIDKLKDKWGLHMNVMLGTFLVNIDKLEYTETKTWGLIFSGDNYRIIKQALTNWVDKNKTTYPQPAV